MPNYKFQDCSLPIDERVNALLKELTLDEKLLLITSKQLAVPRLNIESCTVGTEAARGLVCRNEMHTEEHPTTVFPEPFGLASSFDPDIMREMGTIAANEARIYHKEGKSSLFLWSPTVDLERNPLWGRTEEGYGEDPFLTGKMAAEFTKGMYGDDRKHARVIPTLKHFYANNHEENRVSDNASIPIPLKHDYYLKSFEIPITQGAAKSVMTSYNEINGVEAMCNPEVGELKKSGLLFSVTDGWDFIENVTRHKTDVCHADALARTYKNHGADLMNDEQDVLEAAAREALERGLITEGDIDSALFGVLKARFMLGEFDGYCSYDELPKSLVCCESSLKTALTAAEESIILLRNRHGVLPLAPKERYSVIGVHADMNFRDWYTGYSEQNPTILDSLTKFAGRENLNYESGNDIIALRDAKSGFYFEVSDDGTLVCNATRLNEQCLLELFEWGDGAVSFRSKYNGKFLSDCGVMKCIADVPFGWFVKEKFYLERVNGNILLKNFQERFLQISDEKVLTVSEKIKPQSNSFFDMEIFSSGLDRVSKAITETQNVIVFCGNYPQIGARENVDRKNLSLPEKQRLIIDEVLKLKKDPVVVIVSGYPYALDDRLDTVLHTSHAGPQMGTAVANVLFGKISPAGKCPMTWYSSEKETGDIKDYNIIRTESTYRYYNGTPLFPFGHGLTYTTFRFDTPVLNKQTFSQNDNVEVTLDVRNIGMISSNEVVQLYVKAPNFSTAVPKKELKAFSRVFVPKGESVPVRLAFKVSDLGFWNINKNGFTVYSGTYELQIGSSSEDIRQTVEISVHGEEYAGLDVTKTIPAAASWNYVGVEFQTTKDLQEYAVLDSWQSSIVYENCKLNGETTVEAEISNPSRATELVIADAKSGQEFARVPVPQTGGLIRFKTFTAKVNMPVGLYNLKFSAGRMISLKSFRFCK